TAMMGDVTVIVLVAVKLPSSVVTVTVALPADSAVTKPDALTSATAGSLDVQVTDGLAALAGDTLAVSCWVSPTKSDAAVGSTLTPVTGTLPPDVVMER